MRRAKQEIRAKNRLTIAMTITAISCAVLGVIKRNNDVLAATFSNAAGFGMGALARCMHEDARRLQMDIIDLEQLVTDNVAIRLSVPNRDYLAEIGVDLDTYDATKAFKSVDHEEVPVDSRMLQVVEAAQHACQTLLQMF